MLSTTKPVAPSSITSVTEPRFHATTGVGAIDVAFGGAGITLQESMKSMRLFATDVLPRIRHIGVGAARQQERAMAAASA